jgi:hypothetical protein
MYPSRLIQCSAVSRDVPHASVLCGGDVVIRKLRRVSRLHNVLSSRKLTTPSTLTAYVPGAYPSRRCHLATQLVAGSAMEIIPSKTALVQSWTTSALWRISRNSSQLGQPLLTNLVPVWTMEHTMQARRPRRDIFACCSCVSGLVWKGKSLTERMRIKWTASLC